MADFAASRYAPDQKDYRPSPVHFNPRFMDNDNGDVLTCRKQPTMAMVT